MLRTDIYITTTDEPAKILAFSDARCAGLAVHRERVCNADGTRLGESWVITHVGSGMALMRDEPSREQALARAIAMARLADCTGPAESLARTVLHRYVAWRVKVRQAELARTDRVLTRAFQSLGIDDPGEEHTEQLVAWSREYDPERDTWNRDADANALADLLGKQVAAGEIEMYVDATDDGFAERYCPAG